MLFAHLQNLPAGEEKFDGEMSRLYWTTTNSIRAEKQHANIWTTTGSQLALHHLPCPLTNQSRTLQRGGGKAELRVASW